MLRFFFILIVLPLFTFLGCSQNETDLFDFGQTFKESIIALKEGNSKDFISLLTDESKKKIPALLKEKQNNNNLGKNLFHQIELDFQFQKEKEILCVKMQDNKDAICFNLIKEKKNYKIDLKEIQLINLLKSEKKLRERICMVFTEAKEYDRALIWEIAPPIYMNNKDSLIIEDPIRILQSHNIYHFANKSINQKASFYKAIANKGNAKALRILGEIYDTSMVEYLGHKYPDDVKFDSSFEWYKMASSLGDEISMYRVGLIHEEGSLGSKNLQLALKWYIKAYKTKPDVSIMKLIEYYALGKGCKKNINTANKYLTEAKNIAQMHYGLASDIGELYELGSYGYKKDKKQALFWYRKSFDLGWRLALKDIDRLTVEY